MIQLADEIKLGYKTKQMAVLITDIILSKLKIHKKYLQLLGITTIFITVKSEESFIYTLTHACEHCANAYTKEEVSTMEMLILKTLKWKLQYPVPGEIARRLVQLTNSELNVNLFKLYKKLDNFVDLAISEFDSSMFSPTCIAAAAVMCSFENSLVHVEKWRKIMIENFQLDFEGKIDFLYQNIIQKLLKFYPDYFSFPNVEDFQQVAANGHETPSTQATENGYINEGNQYQLGNEQQYLGHNIVSQEQYGDNGLHSVEYIENNQQYNQNGMMQNMGQFGNMMNPNQNYGQFDNGLCHEQLGNHGNGTQNVCVMDEENF